MDKLDPTSMSDADAEELKKRVRDYWNEQSCDTQVTQAKPFSKEYFEEIERFRYFDQPFIHSFAQFSRYHDKRVLEVGFGAGTDFIQWVRAGADADGIDLTPAALENLQHRLRVYGLPQSASIQVSDAEDLPFESNTFDLGYSFGVLHMTPRTERAIESLVRVVKPGGEIKIMVYNRRSIYIFGQWIRYALLAGKPFRSLRWVLWNRIESSGAKGYTRRELGEMFSHLPVQDLHIHTEMTSADYLSASAFRPLNWLMRSALRLAGETRSWRPCDYTARINDPHRNSPEAARLRSEPDERTLTGNPLGFYHMIHARKSTT